MGVEIRRGSQRFAERAPGRATWHSFSFGASYDAENLGFGPMVCHDDHRLGRGTGFETHRHSGLVIVSWVLSGALRHTDHTGTHVVGAGEVAVLRAGSGIEHSETAEAAQTRFVQVWLTPDDPASPDSDPSYDVGRAELRTGELVEVARPTATATFSVARLESGDTVTLSDDPLQHVFVARGALVRSSLAEPLTAGDAFRITRSPGVPDDAALSGLDLTAAVPTELLVWGLQG